MTESGALLVGTVSELRVRCPPNTKVNRKLLKDVFSETEGDILFLVQENSSELLLVIVTEEIELLDGATYLVPESIQRSKETKLLFY